MAFQPESENTVCVVGILNSGNYDPNTYAIFANSDWASLYGDMLLQRNEYSQINIWHIDFPSRMYTIQRGKK